MQEGGAILSVAEVQELAFSCKGVFPWYFAAYAHLREQGFVALRLQSSYGEERTTASTSRFRHVPILRVWDAARTGTKGWRQSVPDFLLLACDSESPFLSPARLDALPPNAQGISLKVAVADSADGVIFLDISCAPQQPS